MRPHARETACKGNDFPGSKENGADTCAALSAMARRFMKRQTERCSFYGFLRQWVFPQGVAMASHGRRIAQSEGHRRDARV